MNTYRIPFTLNERNLRYSFQVWLWTGLQRHTIWQLGRWFRLPETPWASLSSSLHATDGTIINWKLSLRSALTDNIAAPQLWHHQTKHASWQLFIWKITYTTDNFQVNIKLCTHDGENSKAVQVLITCPNRPVFKGCMIKSDADLCTVVSCF